MDYKRNTPTISRRVTSRGILFKEKYQGVKISNQGGYQTSQLTWKDFHPAGIEYIENVVNNIFSPKHTVSIAGWWYNINPQGSWNIPHNHVGSNRIDYALVFYVTDSDSLLRFVTPHNSRKNEHDYYTVNANKGDILIFPADLIHYVMPNQREEDERHYEAAMSEPQQKSEDLPF